jgi:hypothetical protein
VPSGNLDTLKHIVWDRHSGTVDTSSHGFCYWVLNTIRYGRKVMTSRLGIIGPSRF